MADLLTSGDVAEAAPPEAVETEVAEAAPEPAEPTAEGGEEGGEPAADTPEVTPPPKPPPASFQELLATGSEAEIDAAIAAIGRGEDPFTKQAAATQQETETTEETETPVSTTEDPDQDTEDADTDATETTKIPKRVRVAGLPMAERLAVIAAMDLVHKTPGLALHEALAQVGYLPKAQASTTPATPTPEATPTPPKPDTAAKLKELQAKYAEAQSNFETVVMSQLHGEILDLVRQQATDDFRAELAADKARATLEAEEMKNVETVKAVAPDFAKEGTALNNAVKVIGDEMEKNNPGFFGKANWPQRLLALAWAEAHPDVPMPALSRPAPKAPAKPVPAKPAAIIPKKNGVAAPMLSGGRAPADTNTLMQRAMRPDAPEADIDAALSAAYRQLRSKG